MKIRLAAIITILCLMATVLPASAQYVDPLGQPVTVSGFASFSSVPQGGAIYVAVRLQLKDHWHVNANKTHDEFLVPTTVEFEVPEGMTLDGVVYPDAIDKSLSFSETPLALYEGEAVIGAKLTAAADAALGNHELRATVTYQACDNEKCLVPETVTVPIQLTVSDPTAAIDVRNEDVFQNVDFAALASAGDNGGTTGAAITTGAGGRLGKIIDNKGWFIAFLLVYVWGLALNLTPCVYPMIPITVSYFGGQAEGKTGGTFGLASLYVLGMAVMYSVLGLAASLTGSLLGNALQNPIVIIFVAAVLFALALSMFGVYEFRVPARLNQLAGQSSGKRGGTGAFLMGLTVGIVAAPCIGPFVLALLTFVGESGSPVLGFSLFFTLALGLGTPFLFLAVLSGNITRLPKSGEWMEWVKKLFGIILVAMSIYFLEPLIGDPAYFLATGLVLIAGGILLGFIIKTTSKSLFFRSFKTFIGLAAPLLGLWMILAPGHIIAQDAPEDGVVWTAFDDDLLAAAKADGKYVLIDFTAEWCLPCKELDHLTFADDEVVAATGDFVRLRADLTQAASPEVAQLRKQFLIRGVPTVVFIEPDGDERKDLRVFGFVDDDEFLDRLEKLTDGTS